MTETTTRPIQLVLSYYRGLDDAEQGVFASRPVEPEYTDELRIGVYTDDDSPGFPAPLDGKRLQVQVAGSARSLDSLGTYLVALARLESPDPDPHEHFEDVVDERGGTLHLIVRRIADGSRALE